MAVVSAILPVIVAAAGIQASAMAEQSSGRDSPKDENQFG